ncbi:hypothetical protein NDN08_005625 [Rhodosorus marinus]|uniref:DNA polymerase lambda n=1 Tax=Rhodosorus marinus TaxID=101924 RepID=A0AAV8V244_9RHOD|nr:hypothetical protein NDN08_005625 [Rhodosorus marinus]
MELLEGIGAKVLDGMSENAQLSVMKTASESFRLSRGFPALQGEEAEVLAACSVYSAARFRRLKVDLGMPKVTFKSILEAADEFHFAGKSAQELASYYNELFLPALRGNFRNTFQTNQDTTPQAFSNDQARKESEYGPSHKKTRVSDEFFSTPQRLRIESERFLAASKPSVELENSTQSGKVSQSNQCTAPGMNDRVPSDSACDGPLEKEETKPESSGETIEAAPATILEPEAGIGNPTRPTGGSDSIAASSRSVVPGNAKIESAETIEAAVDSEVRSEMKKTALGGSDPITNSTRAADKRENNSQVVTLFENATNTAAESMQQHELIRAAKTLRDLGVDLREGSAEDVLATQSEKVDDSKLFARHSFFFVSGGSGMSEKRRTLLVKIVLDNGGDVESDLSVPEGSWTLVVVAESELFLKQVPGMRALLDIPLVFFHTPEWIIECKRSKSLLSHAEYTMSNLESSLETSEYADVNQEGGNDTRAQGWACERTLESKTKMPEANRKIMEILKYLVGTYDLLGGRENEFRKLGTQKAVSAIQSFPTEIKELKDVRGLHGIGSETLSKIEEIINTGTCRKAEAFKVDPHVHTLRVFEGIWGAGPTTANKWYACGLRSLDDFQEGTKGYSLLSKQQKIGLRYYDEFNKKIPRQEVEEIENVVRSSVDLLGEGRFQSITCGSYRRGRKACGDVDMILTANREYIQGFLALVIKDLREKDFITDDLVTITMEGEQKYMGVCQLPGKLHRRLDIIIVPTDELACSLIYFTGSAYFNRSMRKKARNMNYSLSQHFIAPIQTQKNKVTWTGERIKVNTEKDTTRRQRRHLSKVSDSYLKFGFTQCWPSGQPPAGLRRLGAVALGGF